jgi:cinnamoyl-CoA reductase
VALAVVWGAGMKELPQSGLFAYLHVEDLAQIHISALEITKASGRYICYERVVSEFELVELIRKLYPERSVPSRYFILCAHTR